MKSFNRIRRLTEVVGDFIDSNGLDNITIADIGADHGYLAELLSRNSKIKKVIDIQKISQDTVSLDTPVGEEEDSTLGTFIQDENAISPSDSASIMMLKEQLMEVLSTLTPREQKVIMLRYGIEDGHTRTLEDVGKEFSVTRERIRQIEAKALKKLRQPSRSKKLKDYVDIDNR